MKIQSGDLINLSQNPGATYQVVNIDEFSDSVWVRRWPVAPRSSPTFAVPSAEIQSKALEVI
jgi:hypothetical protein